MVFSIKYKNLNSNLVAGYLTHIFNKFRNQRASVCKAPNEGGHNEGGPKSVQDLIVRYKEVSSWIKKLIQSQPTAEKRLAIILSAIRCSITCWNIGNFNSSREIWLGLKTALVNQSEDIPGMAFLNSAFDSSTFIRTNYNYMQNFAANAMVGGGGGGKATDEGGGKEMGGQAKEGSSADTGEKGFFVLFVLGLVLVWGYLSKVKNNFLILKAFNKNS